MSRAEERESVLQVGVALCAVERCLQETEQNLSSFANKVL